MNRPVEIGGRAEVSSNKIKRLFDDDSRKKTLTQEVPWTTACRTLLGIKGVTVFSCFEEKKRDGGGLGRSFLVARSPFSSFSLLLFPTLGRPSLLDLHLLPLFRPSLLEDSVEYSVVQHLVVRDRPVVRELLRSLPVGVKHYAGRGGVRGTRYGGNAEGL